MYAFDTVSSAGLVPDVLADPQKVAETGSEHLEAAKSLTTVWIRGGTETARNVARHAGKRILSVWTPEDPDRIFEESNLFEPLP